MNICIHILTYIYPVHPVATPRPSRDQGGWLAAPRERRAPAAAAPRSREARFILHTALIPLNSSTTLYAVPDPAHVPANYDPAWAYKVSVSKLANRPAAEAGER